MTLASKVENSLPKVSYIKASEIWFLGCTIFLFAAMFEFAFVNTIYRRKCVEILKTKTKNTQLHSLFSVQCSLNRIINIICIRPYRKNVPLKKVNSKYILKSTLTPRLARKQFQKNTSGSSMERSRSWSSLNNVNDPDFTSQNYLTVHVSVANDDF